MIWKMLMISAVILSSASALAQKQLKSTPSLKSTVPRAVLDHMRWVMDEKSWHLPNAVTVQATQTAARQGDPSAQFRLSLMYEAGYGVLQNNLKAVKWLRRAAEQDFLPAQFNLGSRYESGDGVTQDFLEASKWFRKAAEQGFASAQKNLGAMYARGQGVPQDFSESYVWSSVATRSGTEDAIRNRNLASSELSPDDLQVAEKRATELYDQIRQKHPDS